MLFSHSEFQAIFLIWRDHIEPFDNLLFRQSWRNRRITIKSEREELPAVYNNPPVSLSVFTSLALYERIISSVVARYIIFDPDGTDMLAVVL